MRTVAPPARDGKLYPGIHLGETDVSDMIRIACVACNAKIGVNPGQIGNKIRCPKCMEEFVAQQPKAKPVIAKAIPIPKDDDHEDDVDDEPVKPRKRLTETKQSRKNQTRNVLIAVAVMCGMGIVGFAGVVGFAYKLTKPTADVEGPVTPAVVDLYPGKLINDYEKNAIAADELYKGKYIEMTGTVVVIDSDSVGFETMGPLPLMEMSDYNRLSAKEKRWYDKGMPPGVVAAISEKNRSPFGNVQPRTKIKIIARVIGREKSDGPHGFIVKLADARII